MKQSEFLIQNEARTEIGERRSRFIGIAFSLSELSELKPRLKQFEEEFPRATHYCFAFQLGQGKTKTHGLSDDGEPKGTAGRPILDVLKGSGVTDCCVVVIRYFGGTKLGTGGLARAYSAAAKACLEQAEKTPFVSRETIGIRISYQYHGALRQMLETSGVAVTSEQFSGLIEMELSFPADKREELKTKILDCTRGEAGFF